MHHSVHRGLLAGCTGSLQRPCRVVHPHIDTLNKPLGEGDVIARDEHDLSDEAILLGDLYDPLDEILSGLVSRMGLAGEKELDRMHGIIHDGVKPVKIGEQKGSSLVGRETTGETDGQHIVTQVLLDRHNLARRVMVALRRIGDPLLDNVYQPLLQGLPGLPNLRVGNLVDALEAGFVVVMGRELRTEHTGVDLLPLSGCPGRVMHAVGNIADEQFLRQIARIDAAENLLADITVKHRHTVDVLREVGGEEAHREFFVHIVAVHLAEAHHRLPVNLQTLRVMTDVLSEQSLVESVVTGRNRSVGGEER